MSKPDVLTIRVHHDIPALRDEWREFQRATTSGPHDTWEWNAAWARTAGASTKPLIAVGRTANDKIVFLLPLAIRQRGGCAVLEWLGAEQGNYASGLFLREAWAASDLPRGRKLLQLLLDALPPVDALHLSNQPDDQLAGRTPFAGLPGVESASAGHSFPLTGDWVQHYKARFGAKIRADLRRRERRLSEQGEVRLQTIAQGPQLAAALDRMIENKRQWFADRGIEDFFADRTLRDFYLDLARTPKGKEAPQLEMYEFTVGGRPVAANLGLTHDNVFYGLISSTDDGLWRRYGPGNILFLRVVEHLAGRGIERIDCGAGDDDNKLRWCTVRRARRHTIIPTSLKGQFYAAALKTKLAAKRRVKQSPRLWAIATRLRQMGSAGKRRLREQARPVDGSAAVRIQT